MKKRRTYPSRSRRELLKDYARYSTIGFQMIAIILAGLFVGIQSDKFLEFEFPVFTLVLTMLGLVVALYYLFKQAMK